MNELERIRQAVHEQRYRISSHANEEMSDDDLESHDVEQVLLTGAITRRLTHDEVPVMKSRETLQMDARQLSYVAFWLRVGF